MNMKRRRVVLALLLGAAALLAAAALWYGRGQPFRAVFPLADAAAPRCEMSMTVTSDRTRLTGTLTEAETRQILQTLKTQELSRRPGWLSDQRSGAAAEYGVSLCFTEEETERQCELALLGDRLAVSDLSGGRTGYYALSGGQVFQEELTEQLRALLEDRTAHTTVRTLYVDLNGDGSDEAVRLCTGPYLKEREDGGYEVLTDAAVHPYFVETEVDGQPVSFAFEEQEGVCYAWDEAFFPTTDRAGNPVVVAAMGTASAGGAGNLGVFALSFQNGGFVPLEVPQYTVQGTLDGMSAQLLVPETGNAETLDLSWWLEQRGEEPIYESDGAMSWPGVPDSADGICAVAQADQGILIAQSLWGTAHADGMGFLVTQLAWNDGTPAVVDQYFDWQSRDAEDIWR